MDNRMMTPKDAAALWNVSERRVTKLCSIGRIEGAFKEGHNWLIPYNAPKPIDKRIRHVSLVDYAGDDIRVHRPLPIGHSHYPRVVSECYYVDKTLLIRDVLDENSSIILFTRPRRFGKSLNMSMLRTFFEKSDEDTSVYFEDTNIWDCGERYMSHQGQYPVMFMSFKDLKWQTWEKNMRFLSMMMKAEFQRQKENLERYPLKDHEKSLLLELASKEPTEEEIVFGLRQVCELLHKYYGKSPIIIIDEYDTPIERGYFQGYYDEVITFMREFFSHVIKDNDHISYAFMTGILRVAKESLFSGLNNISVNTVLDNKYSEYFGFTADEVREMLWYYGFPGSFDEICEMYDGYRFGNKEIFNPWSVLNYVNRDCDPAPYWQHSGSNDLIGEMIAETDADTRGKLRALVNKGTISSYIDLSVIYPEIKDNPSSIFSFLLVTGYLKPVRIERLYDGNYICDLTIPNKEVSFVYNHEIMARLGRIIPYHTATAVYEAIYAGDKDRLRTLIRLLLIQTISYFDSSETFYQGYMLGLCALTGGNFIVTSNRESGDGRYDIQLKPRSNRFPGILIEIKVGKNCSDEELAELANTALQQIIDKNYDADLKASGIETIYRYGVAFCGKNVEVAID